MNDKRRNGLTYAQAGVDIDAGNRMVDLIKPLVRATARPTITFNMVKKYAHDRIPMASERSIALTIVRVAYLKA